MLFKSKISYLFFLLLFTSIFAFSQDEKTILENLKANKEYSTFVKGLELTGLDKALSTSEGDKYTVFAPTNDAFDQDKKFFDALFKGENIDFLTKIISLHISKNPFTEKEMEFVKENEGQEGKELMINSLMGGVFQIVPIEDVFMLVSPEFQKVYVVKSNTFNSNGSYHTISRCIIVRP